MNKGAAEFVNLGLRGCVKVAGIISGALNVSMVLKVWAAGYFKPVSILAMFVSILGLFDKMSFNTVSIKYRYL